MLKLCFVSNKKILLNITLTITINKINEKIEVIK